MEDNLMFILGKQPILLEVIPTLNAIAKEVKHNECEVVVYCYLYGVIEGVRQERAKGKVVTDNAG